MAKTDFIPAQLPALATFMTNFQTLVATGYAGYGLTGAQATALTTANTTFQAAYTTSKEPSTRTRSTVAALKTAKVALIRLVRSYVNIIQHTPATTDSQRHDLGITVKNVIPTAIHAPSTAPVLNVSPLGGSVMHFRIADSTTPSKRAKPFGVVGADVFYSTTNTTPTGPTDATFLGTLSKAKSNLTLPSANNNKIVYFVARWKSTRQAPGPISAVAQATCAA